MRSEVEGGDGVGGAEVYSPIIEADARAPLENSREEGREAEIEEKKAVIGGVWCLSNTERLVMIPLAPHTERERGGREREIQRGREWESGGEKESDTETKTAGWRGQNSTPRFTRNIRGGKQRAPERLNGTKKRRERKKTKPQHKKRTRGGEFKASIKRLVHLRGDDNYRCPSGSISPTSPLHLFVWRRTREGRFKCISGVCFPYGRPAGCVGAGTFCLELTASAERTL